MPRHQIAADLVISACVAMETMLYIMIQELVEQEQNQLFQPDENGVGATVFHLGDFEHGRARVEDRNSVSRENRT